MQRFALGVVMLVLVTSVSHADFATGMVAYEQGNFARALEEFRPLAQRGNADAQYLLGLMYEHGRGVPQDHAEAADWYRRSAEQEHPLAQTNLGSLYYHGHGVARDLDAAQLWYRRAADQGRAVAQINLAGMYERGEGVEPDLKRAADYYRLAADEGDADGQFALGLLYQAGRGVPQSDVKAARLLLKAAKQDHADAQHHVARLYAEGRGVKQNTTKASDWYRAAAANGSAAARQELDDFYRSRGDMAPDQDAPSASTSSATEPPIEAPADDAAAPRVQTLDPGASRPAAADASAGAAEAVPGAAPEATTPGPAEDPEALYQRGRRYAQGHGVPKDEREALRWYRLAAEGGHDLAGYRVALLHLRGQAGEQPDLLQAHLWFSISAERGVGDAADWRDRLARRLTRDQREESGRLLAEYLGGDGSRVPLPNR